MKRMSLHSHFVVFQITMNENHGRVIIHLDIDCFYAQVEDIFKFFT